MKRKYEKKLISGIDKNNEFLIKRLQNDWEKIQKIDKRQQRLEKFIAMSKKSGIILGKVILTLLAVGGALTIAAVAPNIFAVFGKSSKHRGYFEKDNFKSSLKYLKSQKYIKIIEKNKKDEYKIYLEKKGDKRILKETFNDLKISQPIKWDDYWRIIIFDIPDEHKWARERFREKLKTMGFYPLQESVFIYPYNCRGEVEFLCKVFDIRDFVRFMESRNLTPSDDIKSYFSLN
jgi:hypothetical protein